MATLEKENTDISHRLNDKRDTAAEVKTETENARAEAQAVCKRNAKLELEVKGMRAHHERVEATARVGVD